MITAVDTNILIDILEPDPDFGPSSKAALKKCLLQGSVVACEVVWAETATAYGDKIPQLLDILQQMGIIYSPMSQEVAIGAAKSWHAYRERGGSKKKIVADFLIGAHASVQCDQLLSRDRGFYRKFFTSLKFIPPDAMAL